MIKSFENHFPYLFFYINLYIYIYIYIYIFKLFMSKHGFFLKALKIEMLLIEM